MTLIGRPGRIEMRGSPIVAGMNYTIRTPSLTKGVPAPPSEPTPRLAYIAAITSAVTNYMFWAKAVREQWVK